MQDAYAGTNIIRLVPTSTQTASTDGSGVDISDYVGVLNIILESAAGTGTSPTLDVKLQESDDDSTYTDISGKAFTQVDDTAGGSNQSMQLNVDEVGKYIRAVSTIGGTSPSFTFSVLAIGYKQERT